MKFNKMTGKLFALGVILIFLFSINNTRAEASDIELTLTFTNLADAGDDHYEGWLIVDGNAISTGKFSVDAAGKIMDLEGNAITSFPVSEVDLDMASDFVITLELNGDTDTIPSVIKPFKGALNTDKTSATISHNIGKDYSTVAGNYILATPTDGADNNENSGVWYLDPTGTEVTAGLDLPDLTGTDWIYEGWVIVNGVPITTGTFETVSGLDDSDPYSSTQDGPPFPGEDFLLNAPSGVSFPLDLAGQVTAITIEPRMDNSPAPFQFHPLAAEIPNNAVDHVLYDMVEEVSKFATGTLSITPSTEEAPGFGFIQIIVGLIGLVTISTILKRRH